MIYSGVPPQASPRALYQECAPFSLFPESDGWVPLDPSLLYGDWYGNSASVTAPLEIAMGTDSLIPEYDGWISLDPSLLHGDGTVIVFRLLPLSKLLWALILIWELDSFHRSLVTFSRLVQN